MSTQQQFDFIDSIKVLAQASQKRYGVPASVTIAQAILETDWGTSEACREKNNFFGIRQAPFTSVNYCHFASPVSCFSTHGAILSKEKRYAPAMAAKSDPCEFAKQLHPCGWSEDPDYGEKLDELIKDFGLEAHDVPAEVN